MKNKENIIVFEGNPELDEDKFLVTRSNPAYWKNDGVRNKFAYVYAPSYPDIEAAYEKADKIVYRNNMDIPEEESGGEDITLQSGKEETEKKNEDEKVEGEKDDWRNLSWPKLRSKAAEFSEEPINSKDQAIQVMEQAESEGKV